MKTLLFVLTFLISPLLNFGQQSNTFTDARDAKVYKTITIGSQTWMAENLGFKPVSGAWAYNNKDSNLAIYGYLYTWEAANNACAYGWHLPNDDEWKILEKFLGMTETEANAPGSRGDSANVGGKLKAISGWVNNSNATDEFSFAALPGGNYGSKENEFYFIGQNAMFWTSSPVKNEFAWYRDLHNDDGKVFKGFRSKELAFSVRCIKN